jgi:hypothetical protein
MIRAYSVRSTSLLGAVRVSPRDDGDDDGDDGWVCHDVFVSRLSGFLVSSGKQETGTRRALMLAPDGSEPKRPLITHSVGG